LRTAMLADLYLTGHLTTEEDRPDQSGPRGPMIRCSGQPSMRSARTTRKTGRTRSPATSERLPGPSARSSKRTVGYGCNAGGCSASFPRTVFGCTMTISSGVWHPR
jgi:hypothetical protein